MTKSNIGRFLGEFFLWNLANVVCVALPAAAVYFIGSQILHWGPGFLGFYMTAAIFGTLTWGSWASLVWTRNPVLRGGMLVSTLLPGVLTIGAGVAGLWVGFGAWYLWGLLLLSGVGMIGASLGLSRVFGVSGTGKAPLSYLLGLSLFPLASSVGGLVVGALWYTFVSSPTGGWRALVSLATLMVTVMAVVLVTTVIPAVVSTGCRKMSIELDARR